MKRAFAVLLTLLLVLSLSACSSYKGEMTEMAPSEAAPGYGGGYNSFDKSDAAYDYVAAEKPVSAGNTWTSTGSALTSDPLRDAKMIYRARIEMQTLDFDEAERAINDLVARCGGYFESKNLSNYSSNYRHGWYVVRVPQKEYESFCSQVGELCHVTYLSGTAENVSEAYYDVESRLATARIKLERLQSLLARADNMADIITIESAISETEYEIERYSGSLRHYDALIDYSTVELNLDEVYRLSGTESAPVSFGERFVSALRRGVTSTVEWCEEVLIGIAGAWVALLLLAVAVILVVRKVRRALKARKPAAAPAPAEESEAEE